jgi:2-hydroxychromene-2-carboxylate isomerase
MASNQIEFLFDFSSPYGYIAAHRIESIGLKYNRYVNWKPFLLGAMFQINGQVPLKNQSLKWDYAIHDIERSSRRYGINWRLPEQFPIPTQDAARIFYWISDNDPALAKKFALLVYEYYFSKGIDIRKKDVIAEIADEIGLDPVKCLGAIDDDFYKKKLKEVTDEAINRNVCGSPFIFIGKEPFWGNDRLDMVDEWLHTNGW